MARKTLTFDGPNFSLPQVSFFLSLLRFMASSIVGSSGNRQYCLGDVIKDGLKSLHLGLFNESVGFVWVICMSIFRLNKIVVEDFCVWMLNFCDFVA